MCDRTEQRIATTVDRPEVPRVSVVMSVYNGVPYVEEAIDSVIGQSLREWELIVVDDCSTDSTAQVVDGYAQRDSRIRVFHMERNMRHQFCFNYAIRRAKGEFIARLDADDTMMADRLERQMAYFDEHPDVGLLGSSVESIDHNGDVFCVQRVPTTDYELRALILKRNPFFHSSVMFRKSIAVRVGMYDLRYKYAEDYDLWLRMLAYCRCANLEDPLTRYRVLRGSVSRATLREQGIERVAMMIRGIRRGQFGYRAMLLQWRAIAYILLPVSVMRWRVSYRDRRDARTGTYRLGG